MVSSFLSGSGGDCILLSLLLLLGRGGDEIDVGDALCGFGGGYCMEAFPEDREETEVPLAIVAGRQVFKS